MAAVNFQAVGEAFTQHYYNMFDTNRSDLASLYVSQHHRQHDVLPASLRFTFFVGVLLILL